MLFQSSLKILTMSFIKIIVGQAPQNISIKHLKLCVASTGIEPPPVPNGTFGRVYLELRKLLYYPGPTGVSRAGIVLRGQLLLQISPSSWWFEISFATNCFIFGLKFLKVCNFKRHVGCNRSNHTRIMLRQSPLKILTMTFVKIIVRHAPQDISIKHFELCVASTGIEPVSGASETLILSIVLRGLHCLRFLVWCLKLNGSKPRTSNLKP